MASSASTQQNSRSPSPPDGGIPLQTRYTLEEDEYGYVDTRDKRVSKVLISQLPSRHLDILDRGSQLEELPDRTLRRRQAHYRTLQLKNATLTSYQKSVDVDKIYELINSDPDATEEEKIKTLREMHQSLTIKRQVKEKLDADMKRRRATQVLDKFTRIKLRSHMAWHRFLYELKNMTYSLEPWHSPIKAIQGQFGSGVASYFIFLRWLLYINVCNFLVYLFFLLTPQIAYEYSENYKANLTNGVFSASDLVTGSGSFSNSALYFGHYTHEVIELIAGLYYNMPLAYLLTIGTNAIVNLVAVSYSLTSSYRKNYIDTAGDVKHVFCNKVFSAWDYSIETEDAAKLRKIAFCNEIKELLSFMKREQKRKKLSEKVLQGSLMILLNIVCIAVIGAVSYIIYFLLEKKALRVDVRILEDMTLSLTVIFFSTTFYFLLKYSTKLEYYLTRKTKLYLTMTRVVILRTGMLAVIVYFWMMVNRPFHLKSSCYETELGKEIYRLILVNFAVSLIFFTFFGEFIRRLISTHLYPSLKLSQFDVAYNTLDLIYYQTLAWIGTFCIPLASLMLIVILILLFYTKLSSVASNCRPPKRTWSVNEAQTFFLTLTFFMFLLCAFTVGYVLFALDPSNCGPFQEFQRTSDLIHGIFFEKGEEHKASEFIKYLSSPGVMFAFLCAVCVVVYYMRAQAKAHISVVKRIREQLILEGKDKVFLLKLFDEALAVHSQMNANNKDLGNKDSPPKSDPPLDADQDVFINEGYTDYYNRPLNGPLPKNLEPGYMPANVPVNKPSVESGGSDLYISPRAEARLRSPLNSDTESPIRKSMGIHIPPHQPGFRHFLYSDDSPRMNGSFSPRIKE